MTITLDQPADGKECVLNLKTGRKAVLPDFLKADQLAHWFFRGRNQRFTEWRGADGQRHSRRGSDRGALLETLGTARFVLTIPERRTGGIGAVSTAREVATWAPLIERLWDDPELVARHRSGPDRRLLGLSRNPSIRNHCSRRETELISLGSHRGTRRRHHTESQRGMGAEASLVDVTVSGTEVLDVVADPVVVERLRT